MSTTTSTTSQQQPSQQQQSSQQQQQHQHQQHQSSQHQQHQSSQQSQQSSQQQQQQQQSKSRKHGESSNKSSTDKDMLIEQLRHQIEEYFSEQNLQNDAQLRNHMTEDGYINISVLMNAKLINTLSADRALIIESIRSSKRLKMNSQETMVRSVPLSERCTLILRDMPPEVTKEEILQIFGHPECGTVREVRPDIGNTWFVKFHTEEECLKTVRYLQQNGSFRNKPLHVRVKSSGLYKALPVGDIGAIPPAPILDPEDYDATFQMTGQDINSDVPPPMDPTFDQDIQSYGASRYYGYPINNAYDPYFLGTNEQAMFIPNSMDMDAGKYQKQPRTSDIQSAEAMQRKPYRDKRPTNNNIANRIANERMLADDLSPTMPNEVVGPLTQPNLSGIGVTRKPPINQQETSDYPGSFLFYDKAAFLKVYQNMNQNTQMDIPNSMAGRDQRVISEKILAPISLFPAEEELEELSDVKATSQDTQDPIYDESFDEIGDEVLGKGREWARGRGGNQRRPGGRGGLRNIRSFPGRQQQQQQQQPPPQQQQQYYNTSYATSRNKNRNRNNNNYYQQNYSYNTYDYNNNNNNNNNYRTYESNKSNKNKNKNKTTNNKRTLPKLGAAASAQKAPKQPRWVVAGSQTQTQKQDQNKSKTNRRGGAGGSGGGGGQNFTQLKYVPKVTATEQQMYRPKAQPVS